jgi:hypothetical protein
MSETLVLNPAFGFKELSRNELFVVDGGVDFPPPPTSTPVWPPPPQQLPQTTPLQNASSLMLLSGLFLTAYGVLTLNGGAIGAGLSMYAAGASALQSQLSR